MKKFVITKCISKKCHSVVKISIEFMVCEIKSLKKIYFSHFLRTYTYFGSSLPPNCSTRPIYKLDFCFMFVNNISSLPSNGSTRLVYELDLYFMFCEQHIKILGCSTQLQLSLSSDLAQRVKQKIQKNGRGYVYRDHCIRSHFVYLVNKSIT